MGETGAETGAAPGNPAGSPASGPAGRPVFPFSAIVGQARLKLALRLNAVNPRLGGVLIRGQKGTAKSTAVRALAAVLPEIERVVGCPYGCDPATPEAWCTECAGRAARGEALRATRGRVALVELPVGATEDRVVGTLDLERAIQRGERRFEPGLLARANRGIVYIDEVNLLPDHLVDLLLDAAAMGVNYVEREGVSVSHPAEFILIGTMNPEEGELRPQLLDRFALCVEVEGTLPPAERAEVVRRRIAFEADPAGFRAAWGAEEAAERDRIAAARRRLPSVRVPDVMLDLIVAICAAFAVDGLRADLVTYKAARTLAALAGRDEVTAQDVREAAELALLHRRRRQPFDDPGLDRAELDRLIAEHAPAPDSRPDDQGDDPPPTPGGARGDEPGGESRGEPARHEQAEREGATPQVFEPAAPFAVRRLTPARERDRGGRNGRRAGLDGPAARRGRVVGSEPMGPTGGRLALGATLRAAAPHQATRRETKFRVATGVEHPARAAPALQLTRADLHRQVLAAPAANLVLLVVDSSGSMGARARMQAAKGAALSLLLDAYQKRDRVGLIAFRGHDAELLLPPTGSVALAERRLRDLPTGGRTPLAHALRLAAETVRQARRQPERLRPLVVVISDGRGNVALAGGDPLADARTAARELARATGCGTSRSGGNSVVSGGALVVDVESGATRLGLAAELADYLGGRCIRLTELAAGPLDAVIRASLA